MTPSIILLNIIGAVCLLLWGLRLVRRGITRAFGTSLRQFVSYAAGNRFSAFGAGLVVTCLLQSSFAATLIAATFAGQGLMSGTAGLALILGADVGTTIIAKLLSYDAKALAPALMLVGFILYSVFEKRSQVKHVGSLCVGIAIMLFALTFLRQASVPLKESDILPVVIGPLSQDWTMTLLLTTLMTWMMHSSLAMILLIVSFTTTGLVPTDMAIIMVFGANLGAVLAPVMSMLRAERAALRLPVGNLVVRLIGIVVLLPFVEEILPWLLKISPNEAFLVVNAHMGFNLLLAAVFLPVIGVVARFTRQIVPDKSTELDPSAPLYLDEKNLETPIVALAAASRETLRMADLTEKMLKGALEAFKSNDEQVVEQVRAIDPTLDRLHSALKKYLIRLTQLALDPKEARRHLFILNFATSLEHIGDIIDKSMMPMAEKKISEHKSFSQAGLMEIEKLFDLVIQTMRLAQTVFMAGDEKLSRQLVELKERIKNFERETTHNHYQRLKDGVPETVDTSSIHNDLARDLQRISSYVASVGYSILEEKGQVRSSRLLPTGPVTPLKQQEELGEQHSRKYSGELWSD